MDNYKGIILPIPLGLGGQEADFSEVSEIPTNLLLARNVTVSRGYVERCPGSIPLLTTPLPAGVASFLEYLPNDYARRIMAIGTDGLTYKVTPWIGQQVVPSSDGNEPVLTNNASPVIVAGGAEQPGNARKLFVFSGNNQVQVISADGNTRRNMSKPAVDWVAGNYPAFGFIFDGSLWVFGSPNSPHTIWVSNPNDHEDFQTNGAVQVISLFPGDNDKIVEGFVFKGRPYFVKSPRGLYYVDTSTSSFIPTKIGDSFGASFPNCSVQALDDMMIANSAGSITSLKAVFSLGQTEQGDILKQLKNSEFATNYLFGNTASKRRAIYYENKKKVMIASSSGNVGMDRLAVLDFTTSQPLFYFGDKDTMASIGTVRDIRGIPRPVYGGFDGNFYDMDSPMRNVDGNPYLSEFQTHNMDFKSIFAGIQTNLEEKDKHFDYLGITYEPCGNWTINADCYVDGNLRSSKQYSMARQTYMDGRFPLDKSSLVGKNTVTQYLPIGATGKKLRIRIYTNGLNQNFRLSALTVCVRQGGQSNRSG